MRIPALALAQRALLVDSRSHAPYILRSLLVVFMLVALWLTIRGSGRVGAPGLHLLQWLLYANFFFVSLFGISTFSAVVTEEKENMTLGLLQMAGFGSASILVGKSVGLLLRVALLLLVQVPFALLAFTLGGVSLHQVVAGQVILLAHLLFVYALALCASVVAERSSQAARLCGSVLLAYYLLPWIGMWIARTISRRSGSLFQSCKAVWEESALSALTATTSTGFAAPWFDTPVILMLAMAVGLFVLAGLLFEPCTRSEVVAAPSRGWFGELGQRGRGRAVPRLRGDPVFWKDFHFLAGGSTGMLVRFVAFGVVVIAIWVINGGRSRTRFGEATMTVMFAVLVLDLGIQAGRMFHEEIKWRTLPMLLQLPIPLWSWSYAKVLNGACFAVPALLYLIVGAAFCERELQRLSRGVGWYLVGLVIAGLHLTVWLSLHLRRGAFPLAVLIMFLGHMLLWMLAASTFPTTRTAEPLMRLAAAVLIVASLATHPVIAGALARKAGE